MTHNSMPPSSNNTVGSSSSNPKKRKKEMKKRNKQRDKKEAVANKHHHKKRKHREHKESRRSSSGKRNIFGLHVYLIVLTVVSVMITSMGVYYYKKTTRSLMPPAGVLFPGTKAPSTCSEEGQQERELPTQPRVYLSHHWPLVMRLAFNFQVLAILGRGAGALTSLFGQDMLFATIALRILMPYFFVNRHRES